MNKKTTGIVKRVSLQEQVAVEMERRIIERHLKPGDRLPSERELVEEFGVSRSVIRETLNTLSNRGLVDVRHGSGTYVLIPHPSHIADPLDRYLKLAGSADRFENLLEARFAVEVQTAGLAARRATDEDIKTLCENIEKTNRLAHADNIDEIHDEFMQGDLEFHTLLAEITGNDLLKVLLQSINTLSMDFRKAAYLFDPTDSVGKVEILHGAILEQVAAHNEEGARAAMVAHLEQATELLQRAKRAPHGELLDREDGA